MAFYPSTLPATVRKLYEETPPLGWSLVVLCAIQHKISNIDRLTNMALYMHHPELDGRPLRKDEIKLIAEWKSFRTKIGPLVPIWVKVYSQLEEPKYYGTLLPDLGPPLISSFSVSGHGGGD